MSSAIKDLQREFIESEVARILARNTKAGTTREAAQTQTLRDIGQIMFANCPRALANIDRFLRGTGADWEFDLQELLAEDKNVRERLYGEVTRRTLRINTAKERLLRTYATPIHPDAIDPTITIFQSTYASKDWWGALGTFNIRFERVGEAKEKIFVRLSGENVYQWHKDETRVTQTIHRMAHDLIDARVAKPFRMIAKPRTYVVSSTLKDLLLFEKQVNPRAPLVDLVTSRMDRRSAVEYVRDRLRK